jgi:hypothetical protein
MPPLDPSVRTRPAAETGDAVIPAIGKYGTPNGKSGTRKVRTVTAIRSLALGPARCHRTVRGSVVASCPEP